MAHFRTGGTLAVPSFCCKRAGEIMNNQSAWRRRGSSHVDTKSRRGSSSGTLVLAITIAAAATAIAAARAEPAPSPAGAARACEAQSNWIEVKTGRAIERNELFR